MTNLNLTSEQVLFLLKQIEDNNDAWNELANNPKYDDKTTSYGLLHNITYKELAGISDSLALMILKKH